jgi:CheY-like chemotaxis protein
MGELHKQILAVDDDPDVPRLLKKYIERRYPVDVWIASNGMQALEIIQKNRFDMLITDLDMPVMNGFELTAEVIKYHPWMKVVIITGTNEYGYRARGASLLTKPVAMTEIENIIYTHFGFIPKGKYPATLPHGIEGIFE